MSAAVAECKIFSWCRALSSQVFVDALLGRVLAIWDYSPSVRIALAVGYLISYGGTLVSTVITLKDLYRESKEPNLTQCSLNVTIIAQMRYNPIVKTCAIDAKPTAFVGVWGGIVCSRALPMKRRAYDMVTGVL